MTAELEQITRDLGRLPAGSRAFLADWLAESLEVRPDPEVDAAWDLVVDRRWMDIQSGAVETVPMEDAFHRARAAITV